MTVQQPDRLAVRTERSGAVLVLTIDRPAARNALDPAALRLLTDAISDAELQGVRAIVLAGAGRTAFCAGVDLKALARDPAGVGEAVLAFDAIMDLPERPPIVAAVSGHAIGGGFELMLRCDLAVAAEDVLFGLPEAMRGLVPAGGATLLPQRIPLALALELALTNARVDAGRLQQLGLLNRVVPADALPEAALALAQAIAGGAPGAIRETRRLMWMAFRDGAAAAWAATRSTEPDPARDAEMREGIAAFLEKRPPSWA